MDLEQLIGQYITLRDRRAVLKKKYTEKDDVLKAAMAATVLEWADEHGTLPPGLNLFSELTIKIRRS